VILFSLHRSNITILLAFVAVARTSNALDFRINYKVVVVAPLVYFYIGYRERLTGTIEHIDTVKAGTHHRVLPLCSTSHDDEQQCYVISQSFHVCKGTNYFGHHQIEISMRYSEVPPKSERIGEKKTPLQCFMQRRFSIE